MSYSLGFSHLSIKYEDWIISRVLGIEIEEEKSTESTNFIDFFKEF